MLTRIFNYIKNLLNRIKVKFIQLANFLLNKIRIWFIQIKNTLITLFQFIKTKLILIKNVIKDKLQRTIRFFKTNYKKIPKYIFKFLIWIIYDFSSLHYIVEKILPHKKNDQTRPPSNFMLWILGIYFVLFGFAIQNYDMKNSIIQSTIANNKIDNPEKEKDYTMLLSAQYIHCPGKQPEVYDILENPIVFLDNIFHCDSYSQAAINVVQNNITCNKNFLNNAILIKANLTNVDLSNANLNNADLGNANLTNTDLSNANLTNAKLFKTNLNNANLSNTYLGYANLNNADLNFANLNADYADLNNANLSKEELFQIHLKAHLTSTNLNNTFLNNADLTNADLINANLSFADLSFANLSYAALYTTDLSFANLTNANLSFANLTNADLSFADLSLATLSDKQIKDIKTFVGATFEKNSSLLEKILKTCPEKYKDYTIYPN